MPQAAGVSGIRSRRALLRRIGAFLCAIQFLGAAGCAAPVRQAGRERHRVRVGMTRADVQRLLGHPDEVGSDFANSLLVLEYRYGTARGSPIPPSRRAVPAGEDRPSFGETSASGDRIWGTSEVGPAVVFVGFLFLFALLDRSWNPDSPQGASFRVLLNPTTGKVERISPVRAYYR